MKKLLFSLVLLVLIGAGAYLIYPSFQADPHINGNGNGAIEKPEPLRVAFGEWPPDLIAYLAQEQGYFNNHGVDVELVQISGFEELFELIELKAIDVWPVTLLDAVISYSDGEDWQILLMEDSSAGADAVLAYPESGIESVADLEGKRIGVERGTVGEFFLDILVQREDLSLDDLELVDMSFDEIPGALERGEIDAGVTYEPSISETLASGGTVIVDSKKERGLIVDVWAGDSGHIAENQAQYRKFIMALLDASDYHNASPEAAVEIMKAPFDNSSEELIDAFINLQIPNLRENQTAFDRSSGFESIFILAKKAEQYLESQELITTVRDLEPLFSDLIESVK